MVTWGTNPEAVLPITGAVPDPADDRRRGAARAQMQRMLDYMGLTPGQKLTDVPVDVVFIGSCTNGRIEDIRAAAAVAQGRHVAAGVRALVVPGSGLVKQQAEAEGLDRILLEAGFEWREAGLLDVPRHEPGQADAGPALRQHLEPQFRGPPGPGRAHASAVAGDGRRRRGDRPPDRCAGAGADADAFTTLTGVAAPLPMANVDTDKIIPARFLKTIKRTGLGVHLFDTLRYDADGARAAGFRAQPAAPTGNAEILIAHENFGCGSSREHAPWALLDFGIRCVIAPDFADIFHNNCFKNGILPIRLPRAVCDQLMEDAAHGRQRAHHRRSGAPGGGAAERRGDPVRRSTRSASTCC